MLKCNKHHCFPFCFVVEEPEVDLQKKIWASGLGDTLCKEGNKSLIPS